MTDERELWDFERQHSAFTIEGQIENAGAFGRGLGRHRVAAGRVFLGLALLCAALLVVGLLL